MRNSQQGWTINDIRRIARHYDIDERGPRGGSSHRVFSHAACVQVATIPVHGKIEAPYIRVFLSLVDKVKGA
jgi:hypothetical protein